MSDFDREAEREKLREKYERDKQKREASERMSELLLQGATMTNRHCPECQSPVFRYEGREFCPTCQKEVTEDGELPDDGADATEAGDPEPTEAADEGTTAAAADDGTDERTPGGQATERKRGAGRSGVDDRPETDTSTPTAGAPPATAGERRPARVDPPARRDDDAEGDAGRGHDTRRQGIDPGTERDALRDSERRLVDEIASLTHRAAETHDVGRKRDLLAAAREAAETLEAVRRL